MHGGRVKYKLYCLIVLPAACLGREQVFCTKLILEELLLCTFLREACFTVMIIDVCRLVFHTLWTVMPLFATLSMFVCFSLFFGG